MAGNFQLAGKALSQLFGFQQCPKIVQECGQRGQARFYAMGNQTGFNGFDNDPFKRGRQIFGVAVLGGLDDLESILAKNSIQGIILPSEEMLTEFQAYADALVNCKKHGIWLKRLRISFEVIE